MLASSAQFVADQNGNYESPILNTLSELWDDYDQGSAGPEEVLRVLDNIEAFVLDQLSSWAAPEADTVDPTGLPIVGGLRQHLTGLDRMRAALQQGDLALVDDGFYHLQQGNNRMVEGYQELFAEQEELERTSRPKLCVRCSSENVASATCCASCGALMPVFGIQPSGHVVALDPGATQANPEETTEEFVALHDAHRAYLEGGISDEKFLAVIDSVTSHYTSLYELILVDAEAGRPFEEKTLSAVQKCIQALGVLEHAVIEGYDDELDLGLDSLAEATVRLLESQPSKEQEALEVAV